MVRWGITGGIGAGKSMAGQILRARGVALLDTDDVAREVVRPGSAGLAEIQSAFGEGVLKDGRELDRSALAKIVFGSEERRSVLESILHPRIHDVWRRWLEEQEAQGARLAAVVIPLLFEKDYANAFSEVIAVACTEETQRHRLINRGWDPSQIAARVRAQLPIARKMAMASRVVWNEGTPEVHARQWDWLLASGL